MNPLQLEKKQGKTDRRGAVVVEFALVMPLFVMLVLGVYEIGVAVDASTKLTAAIREGGRLASMDFTNHLQVDQTANQKIEQDIRNFLAAADMPYGDELEISIVHCEGGENFDLENEDNYLQMFRIEASMPYAAVSNFPIRFMSGRDVTASMVFRHGRVYVPD